MPLFDMINTLEQYVDILSVDRLGIDTLSIDPFGYKFSSL